MSKAEPSPAFVAFVQATAGAAGGIFASSLLQPLEVVKTRIQIGQSGDASLLGTMAEIIRAEGVLSLFRGVSAKCSETGSKNFVYFYIYDALNTAAKRHIRITTLSKLGLGYLAGVVCTTITMPLEVISTRVVANKGKGTGFVDELRRILDEQGLGGLFNGFWFNVALCVNPAIQNTCFDKMKASVLRRGGPRAVLTPQQAFLLGAVAKAIATLVTFPMVRLKTMLQAGSVKRTPSTKQMLRTCSFREDKRHHEQGPLERLGQLYRGIGSSLFKTVLQAALLYMTKDQIERVVVRLFKLSAKMLRRRNGSVKLGAFSGRPLAS